ncbi:membrane protein [Mycolicibacter senuensis]|uniref:Membrane protein n=2 Tax=Mycolicibacter senuensis TaxID=386913 RepID=A0A7I9XMJ9_9MYCO|nr:membrane protein [Mycolicibacter senuensis]
MVAALLLLVLPGALIAAGARLTWPLAVTAGPALTYGVVGLAIVPFGALGIPWNAGTALAALVVVGALLAGLARGVRGLLDRRPGIHVAAPGAALGPTLTVAAGVLLGMLLIGWAAVRGLSDWQSVPSTWDAVWHANTVRFILDTGQASPTHMGELRNVETHTQLYYPSAFHALTAVLCQLTGAAPTTGYTLAGLAASVWLFPISAALLTWNLLQRVLSTRRLALSAATAGALSASFTALPYVEFGTAAMPNLVAYGLVVPAFALVTGVRTHRDRIGVAVLALIGVFSVHLTGGVVTVLLLAAWWLGPGDGALWNPLRGKRRDTLALAAVLVPTGLLLLPQLLSVREQADIIAGHSFLTHEGRKSGLRDALLLYTRHLNDFPIQYALVGLTAVGAGLLLYKKVWWPLALWAVLVVGVVQSSAPLGGPAGAVLGRFTDLFYSDPRRIMAAMTLLLIPVAGAGLAWLVMLVARGRFQGVLTGVLLAGTVSAGLAWHYLPRHAFLFGDKYDSVMVDARDLEAFAHLAELPGARDTVIGNANVDGSAWMYAVADLHPLWTHYDYPQQQGPGPHRFIFWAYADDADTDPRVAAAVRALNIRYVLISSPTVRGFALPDGLVSLEKSRSWAKIYDNGGASIYEWQGGEGR